MFNKIRENLKIMNNNKMTRQKKKNDQANLKI